MQKITDMLFELQDTGYRDFHSKLVPGVDKERIIGVRTPALRKLAKEIAKMPEYETFLMETPHFYYEENNLHGMLIGLIYKDPAQALDKIDDFLPYVDNWATCDMLPPKCLARNTGLLRSTIVPWLNSKETYRVRFAIVAMLQFLLDDGFDPADLELLASIKTDEYYINMAIAWYYSFALIKQYDVAAGLFESRRLDKWVHNKSIQKAIESYRIPQEKKDHLRTLKIK